MKNKILPLSLLTLLASLSAFAAEDAKSKFSYTFFGNASGNYTMVACSYAEYVAKNAMESFGATDLEVNCTGGIQPYGIFPLNLDVSYVAPVLTGATRVESFELKSGMGDGNCAFDTNLVRALLREFPNAKAVSKSDACFQPNSPYAYRFEVTLGD